MTEPTTLNPAIHAALRRDLRRFDEAFEALADGDRRRLAQLVVAWDHFSYQLHRHHQDEEEHFWPAFAELGVDATTMASLEGEHEVMVAALDDADASMGALRDDPAPSRAPAARAAVAELERILCDHLAHEERDLDPFSVAHRDAREHKVAETAARKAHVEGGPAFFAWLDDGCDERTAAIIRREVPVPVLWLMTHVGARSYRRHIAPIWSSSAC